MLFQRKAGMVGADRDPHDCGIIACGARSPSRERGEQRVRNGHPWIYKSDVVATDAAGGDLVAVVDQPRPAGRICALQRSIRDRPAHVLPRRGAARSVAVARAAAAGVRISHVARPRRHGLPAGARRSGPVARAGRRSLRRLPRAAGAGADDRSDAAGDHGAARRVARAGRHPGEERSRGPRSSRVSSSASRSCTARCRTTIEVREGAIVYAVDPYHGQKTGLFLDQRENRAAAADTRTAACSMPSATTAGSR